MRMSRLVTAVVAALIVGAAAAAYLHFRQLARQAEFAQKITCMEIAQKYQKAGQGDDPVISVEEVVYSAKRNSCIAKVDTSARYVIRVEVVDLITGKVFWSDMCSQWSDSSNWCGNGRNVNMFRESDKQYAILESSGSK